MSSLKRYIVGGGVSGLSAAYFLSRLPAAFAGSITLLESTSRFGGWLETSLNNKTGSYYELGPHSSRFGSSVNSPILRLVDSLGLTKEIVWLEPRSASNSRYIYASGELRPVSFMSLRKQPPLTGSLFGLILRRALSRGPRRSETLGDMSIDDFLKTRLNSEFADLYGSALMRGICAGDSRNLSMTAFLPQVMHWDRLGPNFIIGALKDRFARQFESSRLADGDLESIIPACSDMQIPKNATAFSFRRGMQTLTDALVEKLHASPNVKLSSLSKVISLDRKDGHFNLSISDSNNLSHVENADSVFLCTPAHQTSLILESSGFLSSDNPIAAYLRPTTLPYADIVVHVMELKGSVKLPVQGFGHLVPRTEDGQILGIIYDSLAFPHRNGPSGNTRFTVMMLPKPDWLSENNATGPSSMSQRVRDEISSIASRAVQLHLGLPLTDSEYTASAILRSCIPHYPVGHVENVQSLRAGLAAIVASFRAQELKQGAKPAISASLQIVGNSCDGVGIPDCVISSLRAVGRLKNASDHL